MPPKKNVPSKKQSQPKKDGGNKHPQHNIGFLPPGAKRSQHQDPRAAPSYSPEELFGYRYEPHFPVAPRLRQCPSALIEAVNDFHYAMMNDLPRNEFYYNMLQQVIVPGETTVLEIGAGSGLLSMMAAKLGAKWVVAVEGSHEMSELAKENVRENNLQDKVTVYNMLSTDLTSRDLPSTPDVLVSEIFGTLLLGESALDYIEDVRRRKIISDKTQILPQFGVQYAVLVECDTLTEITAVSTWRDLNLSHVMALQDTSSVVFTKQYGFRMSSVPFKRLCEPIPLLEIDFCKNSSKDYRKKLPLHVTATESGTAHAWMYYWVASHPKTTAEGDRFVMSTDPEDTLKNFPRDMQWGQALQLVDSNADPKIPSPLAVEKGKSYDFNCSLSYDRVIMHIQYLKPSEEKKEAAKQEEAH